jgi:hypothetical protein
MHKFLTDFLDDNENKILLPPMPESYRDGLTCIYVPAPDATIEQPEEITASSMGKIWSSQGLMPIIKDPGHSVFEECPFVWFAGVSETTMHDFIYYLDARNPDKKGYFRFQSGFCGEPRLDEAKIAFNAFAVEFNKLIQSDSTGEVVFNLNEWIVRIMSNNGYFNTPLDTRGYGL